MSNGIYRLLAIYFLLLSISAFPESKLGSNSSIFNCPFYRMNDSFDMGGVSLAVNQLIDSKIKIRESCRSELNSLVTSIGTTQNLLQQKDQETQLKILKSLGARFREDLHTQLLSLENAGQGASAEALAIQSTINQSYSQDLANQSSLA